MFWLAISKSLPQYLVAMIILGSLVASAPATSLHHAREPVEHTTSPTSLANIVMPANVIDDEKRPKYGQESMTATPMEITLLARLDELSRNVDRLRNDVIRSGKMPSKQATTMGDMFQRVFSAEASQDDIDAPPPTSTMDNIGAIISAALNASLALFGSMAGGIIGSWIQASIQKRAEAAMKLVEERAKAAAEMAANAVAQRVESAAEEVRDTAVKMKTEMKGRNAQDVEGIVEGAVEGTIIGLAKGVEEANMHASSSTEGGTLIGESIQAKG